MGSTLQEFSHWMHASHGIGLFEVNDRQHVCGEFARLRPRFVMMVTLVKLLGR